MEGAELTSITEPFTIKDSGARQEFEGGMVRDTTEGKTNFLNVRFGPMLRRWADHLTKGRNKYPDPEPGVPNWTRAAGVEEYLRAKESAERHFDDWLRGKRDEDHAAGVFFNINLAEYVLENDPTIDPGLGAAVGDRTAEPEPTAGFVPGDRVRVRPEVGEYAGAEGVIVSRPDFAEGNDSWDYWVMLRPYATTELGFNGDELERVYDSA